MTVTAEPQIWTAALWRKGVGKGDIRHCPGNRECSRCARRQSDGGRQAADRTVL